MTPEKTLNEYMHDISKQMDVCLKANNIEDAEELQVILEDYQICLQILNFWRNKKEYRNLLKNAV